MAKPKKERVRIGDIAGSLCGWAWCSATAEWTPRDDRHPEGWRALVVSKYSLLEPAGVLNAEVDMTLCPEHVQALKRLLKAGGGA
jgi:hypothetical protein